MDKFPRKVKMTYFLFLLITIFLNSCTDATDQWSLLSPDENIKGILRMEESGLINYHVVSFINGKETTIIEPSPLGIIRKDQRFDTLEFISAGREKIIAETYQLKSGKKLDNRNYCREMILHFQNKKGSKIDLVLRAYNEGFAFRYLFPGEDEKEYTVIGELTAFNLPPGKAWMQPYDSVTAYSPAYERNFGGDMPIGTSSPEKNGWCFPALFETNNHWILLTETNLSENYFGSHLDQHPVDGMYNIRPPEAEEGFGYGNNRATSSLPWEMPWRVMIIGDDASDIVESNLVFHLSDPSVIENTSWIEPGKASWGWWSGYLDRSSDTPEKLRRFIDFAQTMGWQYSLIDAGWKSRKGLDMEELVNYAEERGVDLLLWYNSGGPVNRVNAGPRDLMFDPEKRNAEMKRISEMGIKGIKVDFFSSDKQDYIKLYLGIIRDAAKHRLLVNFHGCTLPRGWARTYPNVISYEAVKGSEAYIYHADFEENAPRHISILPFTRNVVGSTDYTPAAFSVQQVPHRTSYGFELALTVIIESGIQHFPDTPGMYLSLPDEAISFLKQVPAAWDDTKLVSGYPGKEVILARRKNEDWYVGGINAEEGSKNMKINFDFLEEDEYDALIISDGKNNTQFSIEQVSFSNKSDKVVKILPVGGFVMKLTKK